MDYPPRRVGARVIGRIGSRLRELPQPLSKADRRLVTVRLGDRETGTRTAGAEIVVIGESGARYAGVAGRYGVARIYTRAEPLVAVEALPRGEFAGLYRELTSSQGKVASLGFDEVLFIPQTEQLDWGAAAIGFDALGGGLTGRGVRVAVVDTGVDPRHPDLNVAGGINFVDEEPNDEWADDYGHGTFVAGIIGGQSNSIGIRGISPGVELHAVRVGKFDERTKTYVNQALGTDLVEALRWCAENEMDVVNLSMELFPSDQDLQELETVLEQAVMGGMCLIAPSGNDGQSGVSYPAASPHVLGVGALGNTTVVEGLTFFERDRGGATHFAVGSSEFVPWFSNFGSGLDLLAPGSAVASTLPRAGGSYARLSGTSMAAPFVTAACALLIEAAGNPSRTANRARRITRAMREAGRRLDGVAATVQGRGVLDIGQALARIAL